MPVSTRLTFVRGGENGTAWACLPWLASPRLAWPGHGVRVFALALVISHQTWGNRPGGSWVVNKNKFTKSFVSAINYWNILILYQFLIFCFLQRNYIKTKKFSREQHHLTICLKRISIFFGAFFGDRSMVAMRPVSEGAGGYWQVEVSARWRYPLRHHSRLNGDF